MSAWLTAAAAASSPSLFSSTSTGGTHACAHTDERWTRPEDPLVARSSFWRRARHKERDCSQKLGWIARCMLEERKKEEEKQSKGKSRWSTATDRKRDTLRRPSTPQEVSPRVLFACKSPSLALSLFFRSSPPCEPVTRVPMCVCLTDYSFLSKGKER